jgi:hypothetical protein
MSQAAIYVSNSEIRGINAALSQELDDVFSEKGLFARNRKPQVASAVPDMNEINSAIAKLREYVETLRPAYA